MTEMASPPIILTTIFRSSAKGIITKQKNEVIKLINQKHQSKKKKSFFFREKRDYHNSMGNLNLLIQ